MVAALDFNAMETIFLFFVIDEIRGVLLLIV